MQMANAVNAIEAILLNKARSLSHKPFLVVPGDKGRPTTILSYTQMVEEVAWLGAALRSHGIHRGDRVGIQLADPDQFVVAWFAVLAVEGVAVPISPEAPHTDVYRTLSRVTATTLLQGAQDGGVRLVPVPTAISPQLLAPQAYDGGGVILWTSGSTGEPKPVGMQTKALWHTANQVRHAQNLTASDRGYSPLPLFHVNAEVVAVLASLLSGSTIVIPTKFHRSAFWHHVLDYQVSWINAVPTILSLVAQSVEGPERHQLRDIRLVRSASMALPQITRERWKERWGLAITETYGLSEAASQVTANALPPEDNPPGSAGKARGVKLRVVGETGRSLPPGTVGAIEIQGDSVINPRWGPNQWALDKMHDGWYTTGDLGYLDESGFLYLKGRSREVINRGGEKVFPREIEEVVLRLAAVQECAAVGAPHPILGEEVVLFVVAREAAGEDLVTTVMSHVETMLASYKVPSRVLLVSSLPIGPTGKLARRRLQDVLAGAG